MHVHIHPWSNINCHCSISEEMHHKMLYEIIYLSKPQTVLCWQSRCNKNNCINMHVLMCICEILTLITFNNLHIWQFSGDKYVCLLKRLFMLSAVMRELDLASSSRYAVKHGNAIRFHRVNEIYPKLYLWHLLRMTSGIGLQQLQQYVICCYVMCYY